MAKRAAWVSGRTSLDHSQAVTGSVPMERLLRRGGRVVECTALEMRFTGNRNVGSNPTLSANLFS